MKYTTWEIQFYDVFQGCWFTAYNGVVNGHYVDENFQPKVTKAGEYGTPEWWLNHWRRLKQYTGKKYRIVYKDCETVTMVHNEHHTEDII